MTDEEFLAAFDECTLAEFHHRDHLRLTYLRVSRLGTDAAVENIRLGIQRFAAQHGQTAKYHDTMTRFWVRLVAHLLDAKPAITTFDALLEKYPMILDTSLPLNHWSPELLHGACARAQWVEPDLRPMPA